MDNLIYSDRFKGICAICGCNVDTDNIDKYPEFHHIRYKNKRYNISDLVSGYKSDDLIIEEIELGKVILVCHKCHLKESAWQGRLEKRSVTEKEVLDFVKLRDECGMSYRDISEKYGLSISVVRNAVINYHEYHDLDIESKIKADLLVYY